MSLTHITRVTVVAWAVCAVSGGTAVAQSLGTLRWQLQPYCNVVSLAVTQDGSIVTLDGTDDQCSSTGPRAAVSGTAFQNPDGSIGFGLNVVSAPGGAPVHVDATIALATLSGTWRDSAGASGAFVATAGASSGGAPRPIAGIGSAAVNSGQVQLRVTGACASGQAMTGVNQNGTVLCATPAGGGDITAVTASNGLTGGGTTGDVSLAANFAGSGAAATVARSDHFHSSGTNTAVGEQALFSPTSGLRNTAAGVVALSQVSAGSDNTAVGFQAAGIMSSSSFNTAVGSRALSVSNGGNENTAVGSHALLLLGAGSRNTAVGSSALGQSGTGSGNTALGWSTLSSLLNGDGNIAIGEGAMFSSITAGGNVAIGYHTLLGATDSSSNVAIGTGAFQNLVSGNYNIAIGLGAGGSTNSGFSNIYLGNPGINGENRTVRLGSGTDHTRMFLAAVRGTTTGQNNGVAVIIDGNGQLGTISSSRRTKEDIADLGAIGLAVQRLRPVQFRYIAPFDDGTKPIQYGLIAEEVEQVLPELVAYNGAGQPETVKYQVLPTLLISEVQRLERERAAVTARLDAQSEEIAALRRIVDQLRTELARQR
jgi:Chaperone of endosialidase